MGFKNIFMAATVAIVMLAVTAVTAVNAALDTAAASDRPLLCAMSAASWWAYLVIAAVGIAAGIGCTLLVRHLLSANERRQSHPPAQEVAGADAGELVAQADGREIALGPLGEVHRFSIGSGPLAAVLLKGKGIHARHVALQQDGGKFRLCNRSRRPIQVNGVTVCGGGRCRLVMPAEIRVNNDIKVFLRVRPKARVPQSEPSRVRAGLNSLFKIALTTFILFMVATAVTAAPNDTAVLYRPLQV
jgi:hypothetical protein